MNIRKNHALNANSFLFFRNSIIFNYYVKTNIYVNYHEKRRMPISSSARTNFSSLKICYSQSFRYFNINCVQISSHKLITDWCVLLCTTRTAERPFRHTYVCVQNYCFPIILLRFYMERMHIIRIFSRLCVVS